MFVGLLMMFISSCDNLSTDDNQYWQTDYEVDLQTEIYTQTYPVEYIQKQDDKTFALTYRANRSTTIYRLQEGEKEGWYFSNGQKKLLRLIGNKEYFINGKAYPIYKYGLNMLVADGCSTHFWSPELGILLTHSATWGSFSRIQVSDSQKNDIIDQLSNIIMNDREFYSGC